jgi:hypothetical protein
MISEYFGQKRFGIRIFASDDIIIYVIRSKYTNKLENFKEDIYSKEAVQCLNHLITLAVEHIPDCLHYMNQVRDKNNFNFCAIPQVNDFINAL